MDQTRCFGSVLPTYNCYRVTVQCLIILLPDNTCFVSVSKASFVHLLEHCELFLGVSAFLFKSEIHLCPVTSLAALFF